MSLKINYYLFWKTETKPTVIFISFDTYCIRDEVHALLKNNLSDRYQFIDFDLSDENVTSLVNSIQKHLGSKKRHQSESLSIINIFRLENSLTTTKDGHFVPSKLNRRIKF